MIYVAKNGENGKMYLVDADTEDDARSLLGDVAKSDGDEFAIVKCFIHGKKKVREITDLIG